MKWLTLIVSTLCCTGVAQDPNERSTLFGGPLGIRAKAAEIGVSFELLYTGEVFQNTTGGIKTGGQYRQDLSLTIELNTSAAGWWSNGEFFAHYQFQHGSGITKKYVGDFQVLSNIDADNFDQLSELWYKHHFLDERLWLKVGKMDANSEFAFVDHGAEFLNSSPGFSPTIPLTSYPDQDWGAVLGLEFFERFTLNIGAFQGRPNGSRSLGNSASSLYGPLLIIEPVLHYTLDNKPGHLRLGYWYHGDQFDHLNEGGTDDHTDGWYVTWDQSLSHEEGEGFGVFGQLGFSDSAVSEAESYAGAGVQYTNKVLYNDDDILGLGIFSVQFSDDANLEDDNETTVELFYKLHPRPWLSIKPDLQYIHNPGGSGSNDALAVGMRFEISL